MKNFVVQSILFFTIFLGIYGDSWKGKIPEGYLLGLKTNLSNFTSLFRIEFNGTVTQLWNVSFGITDDDLFAVDPDNELVYLGQDKQMLALDLTTGEIKLKYPLQSPNFQAFESYYYIAKNKSICGVCINAKNNAMPYDWCCVQLNGTTSAYTEFLYALPYTNYTSEPLESYMDEDEILWYWPYITTGDFVVGVNYTNGKTLFVSSVDQDLHQCVAHDYIMKRVFSFPLYPDTQVPIGLVELYRSPQPRKILLEIPEVKNWTPSYFGTCAYDQRTQTMIVLMTNAKFVPQGIYHLLLIDTVHLTYKVIPLSTFRTPEKWGDKFTPTVTALKFVTRSVV